MLTPGKDIKDALDEEEKRKIVKYLEKQCKQVKHWELKRSMPQCNVRKDLANIELLDRFGLGRIANNAYYKSAGDELLKKYLETQVYNVILGHYDGHPENTLVTDYNHNIIPSLYYYLQSWGSDTNVFNEYSQESYTHRAITSIKSALGDEEFKKCVAEIMQDFESKRPGFNGKMQELCTELQITDSVALKKLIDGNIKSVKKIAGIAEQGQWANFAQQNNSQISTQSNIIGG